MNMPYSKVETVQNPSESLRKLRGGNGDQILFSLLDNVRFNTDTWKSNQAS